MAETKEPLTVHAKNGTVEELIKALQQFDPKAVVVGTAHNFELNQSTVKLAWVTEREYIKESREFRDAFDGGRYYHDVYAPSLEPIATGKEIKCVELHF